MAFGTGTHPTTQLCLALAEEYLLSSARTSGTRVIDIGCGSGILSIAALLMGAERALGVDIDPEAIRATGENAALNEVSERFEVRLGSVKEIIAGIADIKDAQLVFANILAPILVQLLDIGLGQLVIPDGWLILSGILAEQSRGVVEALNTHGFKSVEVRRAGDWVALAARR
jgi:ribosomal protein L11 methyltransferase